MTAASAAAAASSPAAFNVASYGETLAAQLRDIRERLEALAAQPKDYSSVHAVVDQNASEIAQLRQIHTRCLKTLTESPENIPTPTLALQIGDLFCRYARSIWGPQMNVEELRQMFLLALYSSFLVQVQVKRVTATSSGGPSGVDSMDFLLGSSVGNMLLHSENM